MRLRRRLNLDDKLSGKRIKCPECGVAIRVNGQAKAVEPEVMEVEDELAGPARQGQKARRQG